MAELVRLACFPFLPEVPAAVREAGVAVPDVLMKPSYVATRQRALERIRGALDEGFPVGSFTDERGALHEVLSVAVARMAVVAAGDRQLVRRYAAAEAKHLAERLGQAESELPAVAEALAVPLRQDEHGWHVGVPGFLAHAPLGDPAWKMLLRPVAAGKVRLDPKEARGLCEEALRRRIESELTAELGKPLSGELKAAVAPLLEDLAPELEAARERWSTGDFGPVQPGLFPPCMKELFGMMERGENIPHHGRFAFASFMATIGLTAEQIMDYLSKTPNFDREKSRYQIEHIAGERGVEAYTPPGCQSMQTNGICPLDRRDGLCAKIKHPLSYYRAKLRFQKEDQDEADRQLARRADAEATPASPGAPAAR